ncbi:hypothetical protein LOK49_LG14G01030 [Camellia lanceoleosa]|uniref:Uncharacterized protein n=1 Tax=Camellia lanceoleosa TaxID=1840588 RepID=A0ACC0FBB4_9ERIC|nr:hypothetical protein LOK49_LG14G01030 [Camellia lanceoleosa]
MHRRTTTREERREREDCENQSSSTIPEEKGETHAI